MAEVDKQRAFLSRRMAIAIVLPIVALLVLGGVLGRQLLVMEDAAHRVDEADTLITQATGVLRDVVDQETAVRGYLLSNDRRFLEPFLAARPAEGFATLAALASSEPGQSARVSDARARYEEWLGKVEPIVAREVDVARERQVSAMLDRKASMDAVRSAMAALVTAEQTLRRERLASAERSTDTTKILFVALLVGVGILLAFLSRKQLGSIAEVFGTALRTSDAARAETEREMWIRTGYARVLEAAQGDKTPSQVASDALDALVAYVGADVGALFLRAGAGAWRRAAGVAIDARAGGGDQFAMGEGVIGRAAASGATTHLDAVPPEYLRVRSGTGSVAPVSVVVVPARSEGVTHAVVELGFLRTVEARALALLERLGEVLALAIQAAESAARSRELLAETQRQAEELQTQQEELRVQNEELEQAARVLAESQARLQNQQAELEQINAALEEQAQTLETQRDDMQRAQRELERANSYKSEFLANMSHELRTPLNSSLILAKLLMDNRQGNLDAQQVKFAETIYSAGNDLLVLINDILDLSKIEAGKLEIRPEQVALASLCDDLAATFAPLAHDKGLTLDFDLAPAAPGALETDPTRLSQILKNLLSNAIKFTDRGGVRLVVRAGRDGGAAFDVEDTGIGIAPTQHAVIFEAFRQADGTTNRKYGGTGLGLSISRDLARLLGGELVVASEPGRGSTFTLTLPPRIPDSERARRAPRDSAPVVLPSAATTSATATASASATVPGRAARSASDPAAPPLASAVVPDDRARLAPGARTILVVEDDVAFAEILRDLARERDFQALVATTARDGIALAQAHRPSGVLLDLNLPDRSGLSVLDALKHDARTRHIPVHIISALDHSRLALEMGAAGYVVKPVGREQLAAALQRLEDKLTQRLRRVLVVEDDLVHRDSTCRLIAGENVVTVGVATASEALAALAADGGATFDCMVLDLTLPDRSGYELLEDMAARDDVAFPPVIVYTGHTLSRDEEQRLRRFSQSIIIKGARSPERLLDEVTLFLHQVEADLPPDRQRMLRVARDREEVFEGRRVLVVEDDVRNIFALTSVLEPKGAKVEIARNGKEALAALAKTPGVDLVLMDIMMPEMDGLAAMRAIRKQPELQRLPIIALTAKAMTDDRESCLAAGANDYIAKPLDVDKLLSLARVWMPK